MILIISAETLDKSFEHADKADLCLAMGSSLTVTPAALIPKVLCGGGSGEMTLVGIIWVLCVCACVILMDG